MSVLCQPDGVLIDPNTLKTLEPRRVREGIAEIVKSAAIADVGLWHRLSSLENEQDLVATCRRNYHSIFARLNVMSSKKMN